MNDLLAMCPRPRQRAGLDSPFSCCFLCRPLQLIVRDLDDAIILLHNVCFDLSAGGADELFDLRSILQPRRNANDGEGTALRQEG